MQPQRANDIAKKLNFGNSLAAQRGFAPAWKDRGEASLLQGVQTIKAARQSGEAIVVLVDDRDARDAIRAVRADINMTGTQTFVEWLLEDFGIAQAETAWTSILMVTGNTADPGDDEDPVYIRNSP